MGAGTIQQRSPFGSPYRSPFGSRAAAGKTLFRADGVGTAYAVLSPVGSGSPIVSTSSNVWQRTDKPYNTPFSADSWGNFQPIGIGRSYNASKKQTTRRRDGFVVPVPAGLTPSATCTAQLAFRFWSRNDGSVPKLTIATSDISGFANGWWNNIGTACGSIPYGVATAVVSVPNIWLYTGHNICFILGTDLELASAGADGGSGNFEYGSGSGNFLSIIITP
jgi:hypothetical protein